MGYDVSSSWHLRHEGMNITSGRKETSLIMKKSKQQENLIFLYIKRHPYFSLSCRIHWSYLLSAIEEKTVRVRWALVIIPKFLSIFWNMQTSAIRKCRTTTFVILICIWFWKLQNFLILVAILLVFILAAAKNGT